MASNKLPRQRQERSERPSVHLLRPITLTLLGEICSVLYMYVVVVKTQQFFFTNFKKNSESHL